MYQGMLDYLSLWRSTLSGSSWIDETFSKKLSLVNEANAFNRPFPGVHSVAEIISHLIEWQLSIFSIWQGGLRTVTMESGLNWLDNSTLQKKGWPALKQRFEDTQEQMMEFLSAQDDAFLEKVDAEGHTNRFYLEGIIDHNMYHLGQIGLVLAMGKN